MTHDVETAAAKLQAYLLHTHVRDDVLVGPDAGLRLEYRLGRLVRSVLTGPTSGPQHCYLQAQGYWILACWRSVLRQQSTTSTAEQPWESAPVRTSRAVVRQQAQDGSWTYPQAAWRGRVATVEGSWGALGLLETFRHTQDQEFLDAALRWVAFLRRHIGFTATPRGRAVNYFAARPGAPVPNNSALVARLLTELWSTTGKDQDLQDVQELLGFLQWAQAGSGEFPYVVATPAHPDEARPHFQCFQYAAFQCLDVLRVADLSQSQVARDVAAGLARFLRHGVEDDGMVRVDCGGKRRRVVYHAAAVAAALAKADRQGLGNGEALAQRATSAVLQRQRYDGSLPFSERDYGVLRDARSYPRNLAMILVHLQGLADSQGMRRMPEFPGRES